MIQEVEYQKAKNYLKELLSKDLVIEINDKIEQEDKNPDIANYEEKVRKTVVSENLKRYLQPYSRSYFYGKIQKIVDYFEQIDVNKLPQEDDELIDMSIKKMEGLLISASSMAIVHGCTRQNIHVVIKKYNYKNFLIGQTLAFKLMDIV